MTNNNDRLAGLRERLTIKIAFKTFGDLYERLEQADQRYIDKYVSEIIELVAAHTDAMVAEHINKSSTGGRPLDATPLVIKQPAPCPGCGAEEYADWFLYPHQVYNQYMPGGVGHYCFPCFAKIAAGVLDNPFKSTNQSGEKR